MLNHTPMFVPALLLLLCSVCVGAQRPDPAGGGGDTCGLGAEGKFPHRFTHAMIFEVMAVSVY